MSTHRPLTKFLIAAALVVAPATVGLAAYAGSVEVPYLSSWTAGSTTASENPYGGTIVAEFERTFETPLTTGELDLRTETGDIQVVGWTENAYHILVLMEETDDAAASDRETVAELADASSGDHLDLTLTVTREGTHEVTTGGSSMLGLTSDRPDIAVIAFVPAAATYETAYICSGRTSSLAGAFDPVTSTLKDLFDDREDRTTELPCVESDAGPSVQVNVGSGSSGGNTSSGLAVESGVASLHGDELTFYTEYGDVEADDIDFDTVLVVTDYGDVTATGLEAESLTLLTSYGDVELDAVAAKADVWTDYGDVVITGVLDDAVVSSNYGDLELELDPQRTGRLDLFTDYGDIDLIVTNDAATGYDVEAATDYGTIAIGLEDANLHQAGDDDEDDDWGPEDWFQYQGEYEHRATATSAGFDELPIQVTVDAAADYGDIVITDGAKLQTLDKDDDDDDDDEGNGANGQATRDRDARNAALSRTMLD